MSKQYICAKGPAEKKCACTKCDEYFKKGDEIYWAALIDHSILRDGDDRQEGWKEALVLTNPDKKPQCLHCRKDLWVP